MEFQTIGHDNAALFDEFIARAQYGDILQSYAWGEVKKPDWEPVRAIAKDGNGRIVAAATILFRPIPVINKTIAYAPRGPVLAQSDDETVLSFILREMAGLARKKNAIVIKVDPAIPEGIVRPSLFWQNGFHPTGEQHEFGGTQPRYTFRLSLHGTREELFARFPKKVRYKINYGPKNGLIFRVNDETSIKDFFTALAKTGERNEFMTRSPAYFQKVYDILKKEDRVLLLTGYVAEEPVISSLTFCFGDKAWAVYGGQTNQYRNLYTYHSMNWERIKWAHDKGAAWFDFYGVPGKVEENHPLYGLYHFKQSFGGDYVSLVGEWDMPLSRSLYWLWETGLPRYRRLVRKMIKR